MKEILKKIFNSNTLGLVGVIFGTALIFEFIVFPGLTEANTIVNIFVLLVGIFTILLTVYLVPFYFINWKKMFELTLDDLEIGETELDYLPKEEILKKKRNPKQFNGVKSDEPFVKTRKSPKKPEFPMKPHSKVVKSINKK